MIRELISKFRRSVNKRSVARRREFHMPIVISIEPDRNTGRLPESINRLVVRGETCDMSATGIGFTVSSIRLNEYYLVGEGRVLNAELNLPGGKVKMQLVGQRYNQVGKDVSITEYLVGAKIVSMSESDTEIYKEFLSKKKGSAGTLKLGIDES